MNKICEILEGIRRFRFPNFDRDSIFFFYGPGKPLSPKFDDIFKKDYNYKIYKVRHPLYCLRKFQIPQFFLGLISLFRNGVPVVGVSFYHAGKWYTFRKKTGLFGIFDKKVLIKHIEKEGIMLIVKENKKA